MTNNKIPVPPTFGEIVQKTFRSFLASETIPNMVRGVSAFRLGCIFLAVSLVIAYFKFDSDLILCIARKSMISILPYFDWRGLNKKSCAVSNPWYAPRPPSKRECLSCEDLTEIPQLEPDASSMDLYDQYLDVSVPVVVRKGYPTKEVHVEEIIKVYGDNFYAQICMFSSNKPTWSFDKLINAMTHLESFFVHWENCNVISKKLLRRFYSRPEKLPAAVEVSGYNWVAISRKYKGKQFKVIDLMGAQVICWIQLSGSNIVRLERKSCDGRCDALQVEVNSGDYLVVRTDNWVVKYMPVDRDEDSVAVLPTGYLQ